MTTRRFNRYPDYKDSGVEWLGEIPAHWSIARISELTILLNGYPFDSEFFTRGEGTPLVRIRDLNAAETEVNYVGPIVEDAWIQSGDVIIGMDGDFNVARWRGQRALLNQRMCCLRPRGRTDSGFIAYLLPLPLQVINDLTYSTTVKHLSSGDVRKVRLGAPPEAEQRAIAAFLDRETARIDALVAKKERLIDLLQEKRTAVITQAVTKGLDPSVPMKDSRVEWLDQYPAHWTGLPLKRWVATKITDGPHETPELVHEGVDFVSAEAVSNGRIDFDKRRGFISPDLHAYYCRKCRPVRDDILICKSGATTGKLARVDVDCEFSVWSPLALVRSDRSRALPRFLELALGSDYAQKQIKRTWSAGTQPNISMGDLEQLFVVAPQVEEQARIVAYMEREIGGFDRLCARVREAIARLKELRSALISAAVTGKIDVREEVA